MNKFSRQITAVLIILYLATPALADPLDVFGVFATDDGESHVTIMDCGDGSPCGSVTWIDPTTLDNGETPETLITTSGQAVLGLEILRGFAQKKTQWRNGTIYSPEADKTYNSRLRRLTDGTLEVKGCIGPFCQTQIWTKIDKPNLADAPKK